MNAMTQPTLTLQAFLACRKVRDPSDIRTNLYLLGLAHSASGKDFPRKLNNKILHSVGLANCLGERFASGEGVQDALFQTPAMLFQTDEIDGLLQSINKSSEWPTAISRTAPPSLIGRACATVAA